MNRYRTAAGPASVLGRRYYAARRPSDHGRPWMHARRTRVAERVPEPRTEAQAERPLDLAGLQATRACHCLAARRAARAITRLFEEHLRPHGVRATQFSVLAALAQTGPMPISDLAELLGLERTTLSRGAALMERNGWLDAARADDAREHRLRVTEAGMAKLIESLPAWERAQAIVDDWPGVQSGITEWKLA